MDFKNIIILVSATINLFLGFFILLKGKEKIVNKLYSLIAFSVCAWGLGMVLYRASLTVNGSVFWCKVLYLAPILIVCSFLLFSYVFPEGKEKIKKSAIAVTVILGGGIFYLTALTNGIIKNIIFVPNEEKIIVFGSLYLLYSIFISGFFIWAYINLLIRRHKSVGLFRTQISYVFWGTFLASTLGMVTNLVLPTIGIFYLNWAGQILSLIMVIFIAYAIVRHRLMDIKVALRQSFVYLSSVLMIMIPAGIAMYYAERFFPGYVIWVSLLILLFTVSAFPPIKNWYYRIANKYFFSSLYDAREVISRLSDGLRSTLDVKEIYNFISGTIVATFHTKAFGVLNYDQTSGQYVTQFNSGFEINNRKIFPGDRILHEEYIKKSKALVIEEIKSTAYEAHKEVIDMLTAVGAAVVVPLNIKDETLGVMVLGQKESGDMYNDEDLRTLETIASQAAISIKNAQLYDETRGFSVTLQKEVERQTAQLKEANIELQKLDKAKSDFISIASHQLRTPLTAIKGFTSMILEGSYGRVTNVVRDKLEKILESSERLVRLVNDLLDLSHMEGGKIEYHFDKVDFDAMVKSVVEELTPQAEKKKLKFKWATPDENIWVWADEQKLRQVAMNLIDNAIKYTPQGSVEVTLARVDGNVQMAVKDTGMGMKEGEAENLFQKFVRGQEASRYHTEGAGIGLYVARQLIEAQKGQVWAESEGENKGSTFFIKMPEMKG